MVALLTALAIVLATFAKPPAHSPGISIVKASGCESDSGVAEPVSRDAEEDSADEHDLKDAGAWDSVGTTPPSPPALCRRGSVQAQAAWPAAGRQHGPNAVRGPPA